mgnify:FL=1
MERKLTCIICPLGCDLTVQIEDKKVIGITGNTCPRGKVYAESECTNPQRVITSTVRCNDGQMVSVKTDAPIPKEKMMECMEIINNTVVDLPVCIGYVIVNDVFGNNSIRLNT